MSVFTKHADGIKTYEATGGRERGRLLFAMAILSDCQEMVGTGDVSDEMNEAKELIGSVIESWNVFTDLWGCREVVRDGECEYGSEFLVKANTAEEAGRKAWEYVKRNYIYDCEDNDAHPYTEYLNDSGWMEGAGDYRWFKAEVTKQVTGLAELLDFIGSEVVFEV